MSLLRSLTLNSFNSLADHSDLDVHVDPFGMGLGGIGGLGGYGYGAYPMGAAYGYPAYGGWGGGGYGYGHHHHHHDDHW